MGALALPWMIASGLPSPLMSAAIGELPTPSATSGNSLNDVIVTGQFVMYFRVLPSIR